MTVYTLVIAPAAKADLREIYQYGCRQWGHTQSDDYMDHLKTLLGSLTQQPLMGVERSELLPRIRSLPIKSHTLFYRVTSHTVEIIRVLHNRQDPQRHLT